MFNPKYSENDFIFISFNSIDLHVNRSKVTWD